MHNRILQGHFGPFFEAHYPIQEGPLHRFAFVLIGLIFGQHFPSGHLKDKIVGEDAPLSTTQNQPFVYLIEPSTAKTY